MASSGSFLTSGWYSSGKGDKVYLEFVWSVTNPSIEKNQTTIKWELRGKRTASGYVTGKPFLVKIDDETIFSSSKAVNIYNGTIVASGSTTLTHWADGTRGFNVYVGGGLYYHDRYNVEGQSGFYLDTIERVSTITRVADMTLGEPCSVTWIPKSASFKYDLIFSVVGKEQYEVHDIHPNTTSEYTYSGFAIPMELAELIRDSNSALTHVWLHTYPSSTATEYIGYDYKKINVIVPESTGPTLYMNLSPVHALPEAFDGLYVQGQSKVKATFDYDMQYNASPVGFSLSVGYMGYGKDVDYTSDYLTNAGEIKAQGIVTDSRGYSGIADDVITVIPYAPPKILNATANRCDENGNVTDSGTYLKITATRDYQPVISNGVQKNFCKIQYRYKAENESYYSDWTPILDANDLSSNDVVTAPLLEGEFLATVSYRVEIQAEDDVGNVSTTSVLIPTDKIYWHRDGANNALGLGKYNERENAVDSDWDFYMNGHKVTGLPTPEDGSDAVPFWMMPDYIVDCGVYEIWTYRKWNSGMVELWGSATLDFEPAGVFATAVEPLPFTIESPVVSMTVADALRSGIGERCILTYAHLAPLPSIDLLLIREASDIEPEYTVQVDVQIKARWK